MITKKNSFALLGTCLVASALLVACKPSAPETTTPAPVAAAEPAPAATPAPVEATTPPGDVVVGADYPVARDACLAAVAVLLMERTTESTKRAPPPTVKPLSKR